VKDRPADNSPAAKSAALGIIIASNLKLKTTKRRWTQCRSAIFHAAAYPRWRRSFGTLGGAPSNADEDRNRAALDRRER
jgi:hypothetical protein